MVDKQLMTERDPLPDSFDSLEEAAEFWDTHSTADYEDFMEEAVFDINLRDRKVYYCAIAKDLMAKVREVAQRQGISTQTLVNLWVQERVAQAA